MDWYFRLKTRTRFLYAFILATVLGVGAGYFGANHSIWILLALVAVAVSIAIYGANSSANAINGLISKIATASDQLAQGNVDIDINAGASYETRDLNRSFARMISSIKDLVSDVEIVNQGMAEGNLSVRADAGKYAGEYRTILEGLNSSLDAIIGPLNITAEYVERIGKGDIPPKITDHYNGDFDEIKNNINACIDGLGGVVECSNVISKMAVNNYTTKVEGQYQGIYKLIADDLNQLWGTLNNILVANEKISVGDLADLYAAYTQIGKRCEEDKLIPSYIKLVENIMELVKDSVGLGEAAVAGKLDYRADASKHSGEFRQVIEGFNFAMDAVVGPLNMAAEYVERIGKGDIPPKITDQYHGDFNEIKNNINACIDGLDGLVECSNVISKMAINNYNTKVEGQYQGIYKLIADDLNQLWGTLNNILIANEKISVGDLADLYAAYTQIGKRCEEDKLIPSYIKLVENIMELVKDSVALGESAVAGKLDYRADASKHSGEFRQVIEGFNFALDALIGPLNMAAEYIEQIAHGNTPPKITENYNGDFNEIKNNLNTCIDSIRILVEEMGVAIKAGIEGKLDQRADVDRVKGVYRKILAGLNNTMDALVAPIEESILVFDEMLLGRLDARMTGSYQGDNARLKDALNSTIVATATIIGEVSEKLGQISNGNLDITLDRDYKGDYSNISSALKSIIETLNKTVGDINHAAEQVAARSDQVSGSSQALAQGANEQASAIEQLTAAITEMAAQTRQNAANANQANELSLNARDNATQGNEQMKEMLEAMEGINESSASISKIIKVIDEIAFQTNILALNAAVEAARAGQHGKGFAVVAEEVRNLAARSASAAKETTDLIEGSIRKVQSGTQIARNTAQALNKIVEEVSKAAVLVGDITVASNEQATGIAQVDQGINQVSQVVQTNSATAQESAAASEELSQQAEILTKNVAAFRLKKSNIISPAAYYQESKPSPRKLEAVASGSGKSMISLDEGDFGKY